jgi:phenylacetic acid degradation operon negative regulatory protein
VSAAQPVIQRLLTELRPPPAWSLIVTVYGDAVVPRGGALWLGTLLEIMAGFGVAGGGVRTSISRLASDGWLERTRIGRNSYYRLTKKGRTTFDAATERIYFAPPHVWDGRLRIAVVENGDARGALRAALEEIGFGALAPGVLIAPSGDEPTPDGAIVLQAAEVSEEAARRLAARAWPLTRIAGGYDRFVATFGALRPAELARLGDLEALALRILLIHEYRRIILRDPLLPSALLPAGWSGREARALCATLYRALVPASERWLDAHGLNESGPLPPPDQRFYQRFA